MNRTITGGFLNSQVTNRMLVVDSYARGISIGRPAGDLQGVCLDVEGERPASPLLRSRYVMRQGEPIRDLDRHLDRLSKRGELRQTTVLFGVSTDPFHPFDEKFSASMKFLELFDRYVPGKLVIQTRSPLIVLGLPMLKRIRDSTCVAVGIETPLEEVCRKYTPDLPTVLERWKVIRALRRFGLTVGVTVSPLLPYGDWRRDARAFAARLHEECDFISIRSITQTIGSRRLSTPISRRLASDRQFFWLRHDTHAPLSEAVSELAAEKLYHPAMVGIADPQLNLFMKA